MHSYQGSSDWWKQAVVYQIYPRSFKDSNNDGIGDIPGITSKFNYLADLGIDAIWLSPFYPSALADGGYDVINYRDVDPRLGTLADFDNMITAAHKADIRVIVDIVPNHTSNQHPWFKEALASPKSSSARDRYIFRHGRGKNGEIPPTDWIAEFGGSAWELVGDGEWYLHSFAKEQPDLNWLNQDVHKDFLRTLRFWSDHGTDGFRIDVAHGLAKDVLTRDLNDLNKWSLQNEHNPDGTNPLWDRPEVHDIYKEWRKVFNEYTPPRFAVGEAWVDPDHQYLYSSEDELGQVFNFEFAKAAWTAESMKHAILTGLMSADRSKSTATWVMSNHDIVRHASRYALPQVPARTQHQIAKDWVLRNGESYFEDRTLGTKRARAAILLELGLPGSVYVYQGEELGLFEVADIPWNMLEDPTAVRSRGALKEKGRDGCRVPLPWSSRDIPDPAVWNKHFGTGASFGFSDIESRAPSNPHLPQPLWFKDFTVEDERDDNSSMLMLYKHAIRVRKDFLTKTQDTQLSWLRKYDSRYVIAYSRPSIHKGSRLAVITNFGETPISLPDGRIIISSSDCPGRQLQKDTTAWVELNV